MTYLALDDLAKSFGKTAVLDGASLDVKRGETVVIFGPSGVGKTVLLRMIAGVVPPDRGRVRINNADVTDDAPESRDLGMAFQNFALYPHMPAFENIASPLRAEGIDEPTIKRRVGEVAELLRIGHVLHHMPRELSNGQKQRTALGRALVRGPSIVLLDDPLRNVDAKLRYEMRLELPRLLKAFGTTALYVTQDYKEAMALGDRVAVLVDGRFHQVAEPMAIYDDPFDLRIAKLFGDPVINLYRCTPRTGPDGPEIGLFGATFALPPAAARHDGRECLIGIRPEDVEVHAEAAPGAIPVSLEAVMPLNVRAVLLLKAGDGSEILSTCPEATAEAFGRERRSIFARINLDRALYFEPSSGDRLPLAA